MINWIKETFMVKINKYTVNSGVYIIGIIFSIIILLMPFYASVAIGIFWVLILVCLILKNRDKDDDK